MGKRRGHGEGSIYQRESDGRWVAQLNLGIVGGTRRRQVFYGKTRKEAAEKLRLAQQALDQGLPTTPEKQTVGRFLARWLDEVARPTIRPATHRLYEYLIRVHIAPAIGGIKLSKLTAQDIHALLQAKQDTLAPSSRKKIHAVLHRALGQAERWQLVARNVADLVDAPRVERQEMAYLTPEQARTFLRAVQGDRLEALYTVALALGLRQGEALGLQWTDIDFDAGKLHVRRTLQRVDGELRFLPPKTKKSVRRLALPAVAITALRAHRVRQLEEKLLAGARWQERDLVFGSSIGTPLGGGDVRAWFHQALDRAGLPRMRFHDLRHSCVALLLAQGVDLKTIQEILGHHSISMTGDIYGHLVEAVKQDAAARMDDVLSGRQ
jgi:integrase